MSIVHELARHRLFEKGNNLEIARLEIESIKEEAKKNSHEAYLNFQIVFTALRRSLTSRVTSTYFIAIIDKKDIPIYKKTFPIEVIFIDKKKYSQKIEGQRVSITYTVLIHPEEYQILIGFDLKGQDLPYTL